MRKKSKIKKHIDTREVGYKFKIQEHDDTYKVEYKFVDNLTNKSRGKYRVKSLAQNPIVSTTERRFDSLSRILNGSDVCTAIAFDTKNNCLNMLTIHQITMKVSRLKTLL